MTHIIIQRTVGSNQPGMQQLIFSSACNGLLQDILYLGSQVYDILTAGDLLFLEVEHLPPNLSGAYCCVWELGPLMTEGRLPNTIVSLLCLWKLGFS